MAISIDNFTKDEIIEYLRRHLFFTIKEEKNVIRELCMARYSRVSEKCLKEMDDAIEIRKSTSIEENEKWLCAEKAFAKARDEFDKNEKWHDEVMKEL